MRNQVVNVGNLVEDPFFKDSEDPKRAYCNVRIAVSFSKDKTKFIDVKIFGWMAKKASTITKGQEVIVSGREDIETYEKNGETVQKPIIFADVIGVVPRFEENEGEW